MIQGIAGGNIRGGPRKADIPLHQDARFPTVVGNGSQGKSFDSEREILYKVLFDMRNDVNELKKLVHEIMSERANGNVQQPSSSVPYYPQSDLHLVPAQLNNNMPTIDISSSQKKSPHADISDTDEYVEESLSLDDVEKEMVKKALERNHGKRKNAAKDLNISERTLYRKIKEYGLE